MNFKLSSLSLIVCSTLLRTTAVGQVPICPYQVQVAGDFNIPYCGNLTLDDIQPSVTRAVIAIHGAERRATTTFDGVFNAAQMAGQDATSLIIAPQFLNADDAPPEHALYWNATFWRFGNLSVNGAPRVSSYAVLDAILNNIVDNGHFPKLNTIIVAGHSAGGQFVQRFAAGSRVETHISGDLGIPMRYVVMNPGSWLYMDSARWNPDTGTFAPPDTTCANYDDYGYGLHANLNEYMRATGVDGIRMQFGERHVAYVLGDQDICLPDEVCTTPKGSPPPDGSCAARLQGANRFERGSIFYQYIQYYYTPDILSRHALEVVPGVGHDGTAMFTSAGGLRWIFDYYLTF